jgi:hypothetical protein
VNNQAWYTALSQVGIKSTFDVVANVNKKGDILREPTPEEQATLDGVWDWLLLVGLTEGRQKPPLKLYEKTMQAESQTKGYYSDGVVHIHNEDHLNRQTYLEEVVHHVTGASDYSRDFQDFAFRLCVKLADFMGG